MKTLNRLFYVLVYILLTTPVFSTTIQHKVIFKNDVTIDTLIAADRKVYTIIRMSDCDFSSKEGVPKIPYKMVKLIIPSNEEVVNVTLSKVGSSNISLNYPVVPVQKKTRTSINFKNTDFVAPDLAIYSSQNYPDQQVEIVRTNYIRGNKVVIVKVSPENYNPAKNKLEIYESVDIYLNLKPSERTIKSAPVKNKNKFDAYLKALVDNKEDVKKYSIIEEKEDSRKDTITKSVQVTTGIALYAEYVVITPSFLATYFDDFIEWKKQKGIDIELVTTEEIFQNYSGDNISGIDDNPGRIRQFLSDACDNGLQYALLGGDYNTVPVRYGTGLRNFWTLDELNDHKIPSDLYYSDFNGDWNYDNDQYYGEENDGFYQSITEGDKIEWGAEIFVGRLLCNSGSQIQNWTLKLIMYEKNPGNGNTRWRGSATRVLLAKAKSICPIGQGTNYPIGIASRQNAQAEGFTNPEGLNKSINKTLPV